MIRLSLHLTSCPKRPRPVNPVNRRVRNCSAETTPGPVCADVRLPPTRLGEGLGVQFREMHIRRLSDYDRFREASERQLARSLSHKTPAPLSNSFTGLWCCLMILLFQ